MPYCVDMHLHLGRSRDGAVLNFSDVRKLLDRYAITHAVLFPIDEPNPGTSYDRLNAKVRDAAVRNKRILGFARLDPHDPEAAHRELKRAAQGGLRGIKLHPRAEDFSPYEAEDLIAAVEKFRLPIVLHTSHEHHCHPVAWQGIFLRHKRISFILAHAGKDAYLEAAAVAAACPNVYLDTSTLSLRRTAVLLKKAGPRKIVFASDAPYSHPAIELLKFDLILGSNASARRKIFHENPARILRGLA